MSSFFIVTDTELGGNTLDDHVSEGNTEKVGLLIFNILLLFVTL